MRRVFLAGILLLLTSLGNAQQFSTLGFANQDFHSKQWPTLEKYGLTEFDIVKLGHDKFVKWYCYPDRAGQNARLDAEKVYYLALNECNAPLLIKLSRKEQLFMEKMITSFGDMAKSCFAAGIMATKEGPEWSLIVAETNTAVAEAAYLVMNPSITFREESSIDLDKTFDEASRRVNAKYPDNKTEGNRLKFLVKYIEDHFKDRSNRERKIARSFIIKMAKNSIFEPKD